MCGIAGFWRSRQRDERPLEVLKNMGDAIAHRGPDDAGYFCDPAGIGLVHRRLSIIDLSAEGHQPMTSASGRYVIIFNGEVYNFEEIRAELREIHWRGHSDTEVILAAIDRWGLDAAVRRFVGMFAFVLWDRYDDHLFLVRDRLGIKPLYYGRVGADFVFASELKAITAYPDFSGIIDREALTLYMRHNYIPTPHCIYEGFKKLPPGSILALTKWDVEPELRSYWSAMEVAETGLQTQFEGSDAELIEQLHERLKSAVGLRMIADVPLGAFLSGGIDSSSVVALMQAQSSRPIKTFTIGFHEHGYNEAEDAKSVAQHLGTDHTELYLTSQDALNVVPMLPAMYDEPFADSSQIPTYLVSRLARTKVTVSLSGDGGDELFGGYNRYLLTKEIWKWLTRFPKTARRTAAGAICAIPPSAFDAAYAMLRPILPKSKRLSTVGDKMHKLAGFFNSSDPGEIYLGALSQCEDPLQLVISNQEPVTIKRMIKDSEAMPTLEEAMMVTDIGTYLPDDILTKVDRASMAVSLEARVPLLDHRIVEFAWRVPLRMKIRAGLGKWLFRQVLYKYVPQVLVERPKTGFSVPIGQWLRGPLREWAEDRLSLEKLDHGLLKANAIRTKWKEHVSGKRNWQYVLWNVVVFQDWYLQMRHQVHNSRTDASSPIYV